MRLRMAAVPAAALLALSGCGAFLCDREAIRATLRTPLVPGENSTTDEFAGNFEARRDDNPELDAIEDALEGQSLSGRGVAMLLQRGFNTRFDLSLRFPTPLRTGDVLPVTSVHRADQGTWGTFAAASAGLSVGMGLDGFAATTVSGTARVLGIDPLRIELALVGSDGTRQVPINGTLMVRHETWTDSCFQ